MTTSRANTDHRRRWVLRATTAAVAIGSLTAVAVDVSAAGAATTATKKEQVVKVITEHPFGKILSKKKTGRSLYYLTSGSCRGACLSAWPPFVLPKNSTFTPTGVKCLGTAAFAQRRQVTYRGHRLYTFASDTSSTPTGNGEGGFVVAKVKSGSCPM